MGKRDHFVFQDVKQKLQEEISRRSKDEMCIQEPVTLLEGFGALSFSQESPSILRGSIVPLIVLVGNTSGRLYFYHAKLLLAEELHNILEL